MTLENSSLDRQINLEQAIQFHMDGHLDRAEQIYLQLLSVDDNDEEQDAYYAIIDIETNWIGETQ